MKGCGWVRTKIFNSESDNPEGVKWKGDLACLKIQLDFAVGVKGHYLEEVWLDGRKNNRSERLDSYIYP